MAHPLSQAAYPPGRIAEGVGVGSETTRLERSEPGKCQPTYPITVDVWHNGSNFRDGGSAWTWLPRTRNDRITAHRWRTRGLAKSPPGHDRSRNRGSRRRSRG